MFRINLPEKFVETTKALLGNEYDAFLESYQRPVVQRYSYEYVKNYTGSIYGTHRQKS